MNNQQRDVRVGPLASHVLLSPFYRPQGKQSSLVKKTAYNINGVSETTRENGGKRNERQILWLANCWRVKILACSFRSDHLAFQYSKTLISLSFPDPVYELVLPVPQCMHGIEAKRSWYTLKGMAFGVMWTSTSPLSSTSIQFHRIEVPRYGSPQAQM